MQADETCAAYQTVTCDVLITESTFASPSIIHPNVVDEIEKINNYNNIPILIGCYVIGKAQRISALIAKHCPGKVILTHTDITPYHKAYIKHGIKLEKWMPYSKRFYKQNTNCG